MHKWSKLEIKVIEVDEDNTMTGKDRKSWKFSREITACVGSSPKKNPVVTIDPSSIGATAPGSSSRSSCGKTDSTVCDGSDVESSEEVAKKGKFPTRTWKSNTSVAEMLSCLRS